MKRKKWKEEEEEALIREYSELAGSGALSRLKTRERKFQPIADRVNSIYHLRDPAAFPFRWSWRDVSIKIQNMRHQYIGVKQKIRMPPPPPSSCASSATAACCYDWASGEHHWPNFLRYKQIFGDIDLDSAPSAAAAASRTSSEASGEEEKEEDGQEEGDAYEDDATNGIVDRDDETAVVAGDRKTGVGEVGIVSGMGQRQEGKLGLAAARRLVELEQALSRRNKRRKERDNRGEVEREDRAQRRREREHQRDMEQMAATHDQRWRWTEEERDRWRRREERWEEEEMEWRERALEMQMEHEKQVMQMHAESCQVQTQMLGILVRMVCQFIGSSGAGDAGLGGLSHQVLHNLQQQQEHQQQEQGSMGGDNGKSDASSAGHFM